MEIVLLIIIGLIAKNFKAIMEFLAEQGRQYGPPPIAKDNGYPNLSKKSPGDFNYEDDDYGQEEWYDSKPKAYKLKNSQTELEGEFNNSFDQSKISEGNESYLEKSNSDVTNLQDKANFKENKSKEDIGVNLIQLDDLKKGVIWQEILEPPRARRPYRKII